MLCVKYALPLKFYGDDLLVITGLQYTCIPRPS